MMLQPVVAEDFIAEVLGVVENPITGAVVLLSGGLDSTTVIRRAIGDGYERIALLNMQYGSSHNTAEERAAGCVYTFYRKYYPRIEFDYEVIKLNATLFAGKGALTNKDTEIPDAEYAPKGEQPTVVPFRNANLIVAAVAYAESYRYTAVYVANHAADANDFAYPDCTFEFMGAMAAAIYVGTQGRVQLVAPFQFMDKAGIVAYGSNHGVPYDLTYSCYRGGTIHCGKCPTCKERRRAFWFAGHDDPTEYEED